MSTTATDERTEGVARPLSLTAVVGELEGMVGRFDPSVLSGEQAAAVVELFGKVARLGHVGAVLALGRVEETGVWRAGRNRTCAGWAARTLDVDYGEGCRLVETACRLRRQPGVDRAARSGAVTGEKLRIAAETVAAKPDREDEVVAALATDDVKGLRERCRRIRQAGEPDAKRRERHQAERGLWFGIDDEGRFAMRGAGPADAGVTIKGLLEPWITAESTNARSEGRTDSRAAYAFDALVTALQAAATGGADVPSGLRPVGSQAKVIIRVDHAALVRGWVEPGEVATVDGEPIDVETVRRAIAAGAFVAAVSTTLDDDGVEHVEHVAHLGRPRDLVESLGLALDLGVDPVLDALRAGEPVSELVHPGRKATAFQVTALQWLHTTCAVEGCGVRFGLQIDHRIRWADSKVTTLRDLQPLCTRHHVEKSVEENRRAGYRGPGPKAAAGEVTADDHPGTRPDPRAGP